MFFHLCSRGRIDQHITKGWNHHLSVSVSPEKYFGRVDGLIQGVIPIYLALLPKLAAQPRRHRQMLPLQQVLAILDMSTRRLCSSELAVLPRWPSRSWMGRLAGGAWVQHVVAAIVVATPPSSVMYYQLYRASLHEERSRRDHEFSTEILHSY